VAVVAVPAVAAAVATADAKQPAVRLSFC
jgi:hypothetical protein